MGGSSSNPRNVTMEEDKVTGVVKVSESVARRLIGRPDEKAPAECEPINEMQKYSTATEDDISSYQNRMDALEKQNCELFQRAAEEFEKTIVEVENKFTKTTSTPICEDLQSEVIKCYSDNPKYTLHCADVVKAFNRCVQQRRENILLQRG